MAASSDVASPDAPAQVGSRQLGWAGLGVTSLSFLVGLFASALLGVAWAAARGLAQDDARSDLGFTIFGSVGLWVGFLGLPLLWSLRHGGPRVVLGLEARWVDVPLGLAVGIGSSLVAAVVSTLALSAGQRDDLEDKARVTVERAQGPAATVVLIVAVCVLTPLAEEVFFRGLLFRSLHRVARLFVALPLAGLAFGLVHFDGKPVAGVVVAVQLGLLALFGMTLCTLAQQTGRLGAGIVAHASFNAVTVVALLIQR